MPNSALHKPDTGRRFIFWNDDPIIRHELAKHGLKAHLYPFAAVKEDGAIAYVEDHEVKITEPIAFNMEQEELALTGQHNLYNSLAAGISANLAGIAKENIRKALSDFRGVEHRLEKWRVSAALILSMTQKRRMSTPAGMPCKA